MIDAILKNKVVVGVVVLIILVGLFFGMQSSSVTPTPILQTSQQSDAEKQMVTTLLTLRAVNLSGTIFSDPVFLSLKDFSTEIKDEPKGREDPFAPYFTVANPATAVQNQKNTGPTFKEPTAQKKQSTQK